jgi:hypothetical protein
MDELLGYIDEYTKNLKGLNEPLATSALYVYDNYANKKGKSFLNMVKPEYEINKNHENMQNYFERAGEIPLRSEFEKYFIDTYRVQVKDQVALMPRIDSDNSAYAYYFLIVGSTPTDSDWKFNKKLLNKVIEITESDKYNASRISAQKILDLYSTMKTE